MLHTLKWSEFRAYTAAQVKALAQEGLEVTADGETILRTTQDVTHPTGVDKMLHMPAKEKKLAIARRALSATQDVTLAKNETNTSNHDVTHAQIPLYNPGIHKAGDTVRVLRGGHARVITIPDLDADGHPMP